MSAVTPHDPADGERTAADIAAAKRVLSHIQSYLELLTADVRDLMNALDKGPGAASELAAELLDDPEDSWRYTGGGTAMLGQDAPQDPMGSPTSSAAGPPESIGLDHQ